MIVGNHCITPRVRDEADTVTLWRRPLVWSPVLSNFKKRYECVMYSLHQLEL